MKPPVTSLAALQKENAVLESILEGLALSGQGTFELSTQSSVVFHLSNFEPLIEKWAKLGVIEETSRAWNKNGHPIYPISPGPQWDAYIHEQRVLLGEAGQPGSNSPVWIDYNEDQRDLLLNGVFLLSTPHYDSTNHRVFSYLYLHANQQVNPKELWHAIGGTDRSISNILNDLGFRGTLRDLFFDTSAQAICFHNPVSLARFKRLCPDGKVRLTSVKGGKKVVTDDE
jgi:hypothetical protein